MHTENKNGKQKPDAPNWLLENIAEASRNARKIYFLYVGFLAYSVLTVVSTSDRQIILNDTAKLPIINVDVSLNGFFLLAPVVATLFFVYLQLYLQRLKGLIDDLRTSYAPTQKRRLYPWMINIAEDPEPGAIGVLQRMIVSFSLWTSLTLVLIVFAFWYVKKHDPIWSYVVGIEPIVAFLITFWFWRKYEPGNLQESTLGRSFSLIGFCSVIAFELILIVLLIPWAREGGKYEWLKPFICVNLSYQKLVTEPETDYEGLFWGDLSNTHLQGADLTSSVLRRANLENANLQAARLQSATLDEANLTRANLQKADLAEANLQKATLEDANLNKARLDKANLRGANLDRANLQEASVNLTVLSKSSFSSAGADLQGAGLYGANLERLSLWASNLQEADLRTANLKDAMLSSANLRGAKMKGTNLENAQLTGYSVVHDSGKRYHVRTNLQEADLRTANLRGARLDGANLRATDLRGAKNLTLEQLSKVSTLYKAKLDPHLLAQIKKAHRHLLEEPDVTMIDMKILEEIEKAFPYLLVESDKGSRGESLGK